MNLICIYARDSIGGGKKLYQMKDVHNETMEMKKTKIGNGMTVQEITAFRIQWIQMNGKKQKE